MKSAVSGNVAASYSGVSHSEDLKARGLPAWRSSIRRGDGGFNVDIEDNSHFRGVLLAHYGERFLVQTRVELSDDLLAAWERRLLRDSRASWVKIKERSIPVSHCLEIFRPKQDENAIGVEKALQQTNGLIGLMFEVLRRTVCGSRTFDHNRCCAPNWLLYWLRLQSLDILDQSTSVRRNGAEVPRWISIHETAHSFGEYPGGRDATVEGSGFTARWGQHHRLSDTRDPLEILQHREVFARFHKMVLKEEKAILEDIDSRGSAVLSWCARQVMTGKSRQEILLSRKWADEAEIHEATNAMLDQACTRFRQRVRALKLEYLALAIVQAQENPRLRTIPGEVPLRLEDD